MGESHRCSPKPSCCQALFAPLPTSEKKVFWVLFKPSPPYLPFLSCPGALPAETSDFRSLSCLESNFHFPWKPSSICPCGAASPWDTACSQHGLKKRKSRETPQRVVKVLPDHQLKGTEGFPIPHLGPLPILEFFSHRCGFSCSATGEEEEDFGGVTTRTLMAGWGGGRVVRNLLPRFDPAPPWKRGQQKLHAKNNSSLQRSSLPK